MQYLRPIQHCNLRASQVPHPNKINLYDHASLNARGISKLGSGDLDGALEDFESAKVSCFALAKKECEEFDQRKNSFWTGPNYRTYTDDLSRSNLAACRNAAPYAFNCGVVHERKGNWEEAIKHYEHARILSGWGGDIVTELQTRDDVKKALTRIEAERMKDPVYVAEKRRIAEEERLERERERQKEMLKDAIREALSSEFSDLRHDVRGVGKKVEEVGNKIERSLHWPEEGSIHFYKGFGSEHLGSAYWTRRRI